MTNLPPDPPQIIRTSRGLTISGLRITLYDVMDHLLAGRPRHLILNWLPLTKPQLEAALAYIDQNRTEVETEYQQILQTAAENRRYWEEKNQDRLAKISQKTPQANRQELWQKLQAQKAQHAH